MTATDRLELLDRTDPAELCTKADAALTSLVNILNQETTLLRAGKLKLASELAAPKACAAEDYTILARAVQRGAKRLAEAVPAQLAALHHRHESLATQMADNLRVLATARNVTEDLLTDVALTLGRAQAPKTYSSSGGVAPTKTNASGLSVNRAL